MPLYMDIHRVPGATANDLAQAHAHDMQVQDGLGVCCVKYWFNESSGKVFCLIDAPSAEAANEVHARSHGLLAEKIIEVDPDMAEGLLGDGEVNMAGAVMMPNAQQGRDTGLRSVMFTDIVGSTRITQRLGDAAAMRLVNLHDEVVRAALGEHGGREVKHTGDGIMSSFFSAVAAVRCATQIQRELARRRDGNGHDDEFVRVRIGAAAGEPVEQRHDLFGSTVQLAARLCAFAAPDQVVVSTDLADLCREDGLEFDEPVHAQLKGFEEPVRAHIVRYADHQ
jgi:class 3 adenylate cyclase